MLFMFFQFIICLRINFLLSVEACHISEFDLASFMSWLSKQKEFFLMMLVMKQDICEHEIRVMLSKHENGYKYLIITIKCFRRKASTVLSPIIRKKTLMRKMKRKKMLVPRVTS